LFSQPSSATLHPHAVPPRRSSDLSGLYRDTTRDTELGGVRLPKGSRVVLRYNSANRDQAHFHQAETFDITRKPSRHLSFGLGTQDRKSTRLNSSHVKISYAVFCLK